MKRRGTIGKLGGVGGAEAPVEIDRLLGNLYAFASEAAARLGGDEIVEQGVAGFLSSNYDGFLNQFFATGADALRSVADTLDGRPAFVWVSQRPSRQDLSGLKRDDWTIIDMEGMSASTRPGSRSHPHDAEAVVVQREADFKDWHEVYCDVFGADVRSEHEWRTLFEALSAQPADALVLLLARHEGGAAACGSVYIRANEAGLYSFATREPLRRRGLASALIHTAHQQAQARGAPTATLEARPEAVSVYQRAGYHTEQVLPLVMFG
jgi:GNAT superfamily N-acetyltransferase